MGSGEYKSTIKTGDEAFHLNGKRIDDKVLSFWQWSSSDLLGNALRGVLAEYIVSIDVPCESDFRDTWDAYDLVAQDGTKIEVKSASYLQSWKQEKLSAISFGIQPTFGWDAKTNTQSKILKRQADVYVFCVLSHQDKSSVDPMNLSQWDFYVLATQVLDQVVPNQKTITLSSLLNLNPAECQFGEIWNAIRSVRN